MCGLGLNEVLYCSDYKTHFPPEIWEGNGSASHSLNVAYQAHGGGEGGEWMAVEQGFSFLFSSCKT